MVRFLFALCLLSFGFCRVASAEYPEKTITVVCPWSAGGGTDRLSRYMADQLQSRLDTPAIVVNKTGGSGAIGHTAIAQAPPNGYTIGMITAELSTMHHMGLCNLTYRDYNCLMQLNADAAALIVRQNAPWKNLGELLEEIRRRPGELKMSGTATGGLWDLARAGMLHTADLDVSSVIWVPTKGSAPSLVDLLGGHVDAVCCSVPEAASQLEAGELRVLAVFSEERLPEFPDMPTAKEQGLDWVGMGWRGLALPKDTPPEIAQRLEKELTAIVRSEDYRDFMKKNGFGIAIKGPEDFETFLEKQEDQWKEVLEAAGYTEMENHDPGPFALPIALGAVLFIGVLAQLLAFSRKPRDPETPDEEDPSRDETEKPRNASAAIVIAAMVAYLSLMNVLGFSLATVLLAGGLIWHFGSRWWTAILSAVILTVVVNAVFTLIFKVPLPEGKIELPFAGTPDAWGESVAIGTDPGSREIDKRRGLVENGPLGLPPQVGKEPGPPRGLSQPIRLERSTSQCRLLEVARQSRAASAPTTVVRVKTKSRTFPIATVSVTLQSKRLVNSVSARSMTPPGMVEQQ